MKSTINGSSVYQVVTKKVILYLSENVIPWKQPWCSLKFENEFYNAVNHRIYKGLINRILLGKPGGYITWSKLNELGGSVIKGAKQKMWTHWTPYIPKDKKQEAKEREANGLPLDDLYEFSLRYYTGYHTDDVTGVKLDPIEDPVNHKAAQCPTDIADMLIREYAEKTGVQVIETSDRYTYDYDADTVYVPRRTQYATEEQWYNAVFAALTKSTAISSRCNRKSAVANAMKGNEDTIKEELISEMSASMIMNFIEMVNDESENDTKSACQKWILELQKNFRLVVDSASHAEAAAKYILQPLLA